MKYLKPLSVVLTLALCASLLAACGTPKTTSGTSSEATSASGSTSASSSTVEEPAHEPGLFVDEKKVEADPIMTVNGEDVPFDLFRYHYMSAKFGFDGGDQAAWEGDDAAELKQQLLDYAQQGVLSGYAIRAVAKENKLELTADETKEVEESVKSLVEQMGGEEAYQAALAEQYYTDEVYRYLYTTSAMMEKVLRQVYGDQIKADVKENYVHAQHILIPFTDAEAEEHADDLKKAEEVLAKVKAGDDFTALVKEYGQDPGQPEEGYYFTKGEMVQEFEDAAYALKDNETSEIVATSYGYHILRRLPMEESYIDENLTGMLSSTLATELTKTFDDKAKTFEVTYSDNYKLVAPDTMF